MRGLAGATWGRVIVRGTFLGYALATADVAGFAVILWLLKPFWTPIDSRLADMLGRRLLWTSLIFAVALILGGLFGLLLARAVRTARAGRFPVMSALFCPVALAVALYADALLYKLLEALEKDRMLLVLRAIDCAPYVAVVAGLAFFILILPRLSFWRSRRVRWALFAFLVIVTALAVYKPWPPRIVAGPWLEFSGDGGITVSWMTDRPTMGWVEYGPTLPSEASRRKTPNVSQRAQTFRYGLNDADSRVHRVTLAGLQPGATIPYRVVSRDTRAIEPSSAHLGAKVASATFTFTAPDPHAEEVSFVLFSDLHEQFNLLPDLLKAVDIKKRAFVVFNGDTLFQVQNEYQVRRFLRAVSRQFAAEVPFVFVRGNHDTTGPFARSLPAYIGFADSPYVACLRMGPAALLVLDTGGDQRGENPDFSELVDFPHWRDEQAGMLGAVVSSPLWTSAPFRILCCHIPLEAGSSGWWPVLDGGGLNLELAGHYHSTRFTTTRSGASVLVASGEAWFEPESYPAYVITVTRQHIVIEKISRTGQKAGQWEIRPCSEPR